MAKHDHSSRDDEFDLAALPPDAIYTLAGLLFRSPEHGTGTPHPLWLAEQGQMIAALQSGCGLLRGDADSSAATQASGLATFLRLTPGRRAPGCVLCETHSPLDPALVRFLFRALAKEATFRADRVREYRNKYGVGRNMLDGEACGPEVKDFVDRISGLCGLWLDPSLPVSSPADGGGGYDSFEDVFGPFFPDALRLERAVDGCEACMLAAAGARPAALVDLRANMAARTKKRAAREGRLPRLMALVEAWMEHFGAEAMAGMLAASDNLAGELRHARDHMKKRRQNKEAQRKAEEEGASAAGVGGAEQAAGKTQKKSSKDSGKSKGSSHDHHSGRSRSRSKSRSRSTQSHHRGGGTPHNMRTTRTGIPLPQVSIHRDPNDVTASKLYKDDSLFLNLLKQSREPMPKAAASGGPVAEANRLSLPQELNATNDNPAGNVNACPSANASQDSNGQPEAEGGPTQHDVLFNNPYRGGTEYQREIQEWQARLAAARDPAYDPSTGSTAERQSTAFKHQSAVPSPLRVTAQSNLRIEKDEHGRYRASGGSNSWRSSSKPVSSAAASLHDAGDTATDSLEQRPLSRASNAASTSKRNIAAMSGEEKEQDKQQGESSMRHNPFDYEVKEPVAYAMRDEIAASSVYSSDGWPIQVPVMTSAIPPPEEGEEEEEEPPTPTAAHPTSGGSTTPTQRSISTMESPSPSSPTRLTSQTRPTSFTPSSSSSHRRHRPQAESVLDSHFVVGQPTTPDNGTDEIASLLKPAAPAHKRQSRASRDTIDDSSSSSSNRSSGISDYGAERTSEVHVGTPSFYLRKMQEEQLLQQMRQRREHEELLLVRAAAAAASRGKRAPDGRSSAGRRPKQNQKKTAASDFETVVLFDEDGDDDDDESSSESDSDASASGEDECSVLPDDSISLAAGRRTLAPGQPQTREGAAGSTASARFGRVYRRA